MGAAQQSRITAFYAANQSNDQTIYDLKKKKKKERGATDRTNEAYNNVADHQQADFARELVLENNNYNNNGEEVELFEEGKGAAVRPDVAILSAGGAASEAVTLDVPDQE